jgi:large subunit ribosomal protein L19
MNLLQEIQELPLKNKKALSEIRAGHTVRVHQIIKEGDKERVQIFEGLVIKVNSGHGADKTITVRKVVEGIGVEKIFPVYSPIIKKIEIKKQSKVRRAKLYYMRGRFGKSARMKEDFVEEEAEVEKSIEELAAIKAKEEAAKAKAEGRTAEAEEAA